ncbi:galactose-1-phosphate uridylyltransferase-like protein, partial [Euroglyphus maynei]
KRPWLGKIEKNEDQNNDSDTATEVINALSPGGIRANGKQNPEYNSTYVFDNDFPSLIDNDCPDDLIVNDDDDSQLFRIEPARGRCRVMCFHPSSRLSLPLMSIDEILTVINAWIEELLKLSPIYRWVQIFENKGAIMGCSNPHPHCQIWASRFLPNIARQKDKQQRDYFNKHGSPMLWDYCQKELINGERILLKNEHWLVLIPFWATWPFETMLLPHHRCIQRLNEINELEKQSLAFILKKLLTIYDNLFETSFPYSMGWHGAPTGVDDWQSQQPHWILHAVYYP